MIRIVGFRKIIRFFEHSEIVQPAEDVYEILNFAGGSIIGNLENETPSFADRGQAKQFI